MAYLQRYAQFYICQIIFFIDLHIRTRKINIEKFELSAFLSE